MGSIPTGCKCCVLEQDTLSTLLSTGFYPGREGHMEDKYLFTKCVPSINKVHYDYFIIIIIQIKLSLLYDRVKFGPLGIWMGKR